MGKLLPNEQNSNMPLADLPSSERVFNTVELIEAVLLELPLKDVLLAQRVCKTWQAAIAASSPLQRALCLRPIKTPIDELRKVIGQQISADALPLITVHPFEDSNKLFEDELPDYDDYTAQMNLMSYIDSVMTMWPWKCNTTDVTAREFLDHYNAVARGVKVAFNPFVGNVFST